MSKKGYQANSARFCSTIFALMVSDDSPKDCLIVAPMFDASKYKSDITRVSNTIAKYLKESPAKCESN